ncbi:hypothetical protein CIB48_g1236 [Xylaria polymorpha]|nr:hypothetical protein CIB48_g1236 [Xylaria polymorpha]
MYSRPTFWLEFRLLSDGLQTTAVHAMPLTRWHEANTPAFPRFSSLPAELRLKVWEYLIAPRIVGIACRKFYIYPSIPNISTYLPLLLSQSFVSSSTYGTWKSVCIEDGASSIEAQRDMLWGPHPDIRPAVPVLMHINRETRALGRRHYELSFEWKVPRVLASADLHPPVPMRSPMLAALPLPAVMPQSTNGSFNPTDDPSFFNIGSYHDLLDPSPRPSTLGVGEGRRTAAEAGSTTNGTTGGGGGGGGSGIFSPQRRTSSPPRTWFNFDLDAVYLLGELEPCDSFGFNSPMTYFIPSQTARRVRKAAVSFGALGYGETGGQQIFGALFHVVDRFPPLADDGEVLVCVTERDEWTHAMMGPTDTGPRRKWGAGLVLTMWDGAGGGGAADDEGEGNVVQKIWRDWYRGAIVTSPLKNLRFSLIPEHDLESYVYDFMMAKPRARGKNRTLAPCGGRK